MRNLVVLPTERLNQSGESDSRGRVHVSQQVRDDGGIVVGGWRDIEATKGQYDWHRSDRIVLSMNDAGMDMIVRLDFQPDWARSGCSLQGPPTNLQDFANFVSAVATRYRGRIRAYEIWNEPNLAREWCDQAPSGAAYTQLLRVAYTAIKAADPTAWVVTAGLSPTTRNDAVEQPMWAIAADPAPAWGPSA